MKKKSMIHILLMALVALNACTEEKVIPPMVPAQPVSDQNWQFETTPMWSDEFNTDGSVDATKWSFETGGNGWGNNELEYYTAGNNAAITGGNLAITAKKESVSGMNYTSTRMVTKGKADFLYGRFEVRAKLPKGRGTWPAIWMLYTDPVYGDWPASGEIDIMEHVGFDPGNVHFSIHTSAYNHVRGTQKTSTKYVGTAMDDFHVYRLDWTPFSIRGFIDDEQYFEFKNENTGFSTWPFDKKQFMILNLAVGGDWGGSQGVDDSVFPATMLVDYVKVYKMIPQ